MGAAAFIMAEFLGIPYVKIALCAVLPALIHFFAVGWMVHLEAKKTGLLGLPREMLPNLWLVLKERWLLVGPLIIIVYLLITGSSPFLAAFWGIIFATATGQVHERTKPFLLPLFLCVPPVLFGMNPFTDIEIIVGWFGFIAIALFYFWRTTELLSTGIALGVSAFLTALLFLGVEPSLCAFWANMIIIGVGICYKESKMRFHDILTSLEEGTKNAIAIGAACACVGFIVGATTLTGIGLQFATAVIAVAHNIAEILNPLLFGLTTVSDITLFFTLVNTALACFILGMGIPTTAQYIIAAMIAAPALLQWGIHPLLSHMFVFFYAILADVTPPVALAAYAAAGVAAAIPSKRDSGPSACRAPRPACPLPSSMRRSCSSCPGCSTRPSNSTGSGSSSVPSRCCWAFRPWGPPWWATSAGGCCTGLRGPSWVSPLSASSFRVRSRTRSASSSMWRSSCGRS